MFLPQSNSNCWVASVGSCLLSKDSSGLVQTSCSCLPLFTGDRCEISAVCTERQCSNGGTCLRQGNTFSSVTPSAKCYLHTSTLKLLILGDSVKCKCRKDFTGENCEHACQPACSVNQTCEFDEILQIPRCICLPNTHGDNCELSVSCSSYCYHGGSCMGCSVGTADDECGSCCQCRWDGIFLVHIYTTSISLVFNHLVIVGVVTWQSDGKSSKCKTGLTKSPSGLSSYLQVRFILL